MRLTTIHLNGKPQEIPDGLTLASLLEWLKMPADRVAVERNLEIVPRARWRETAVEAGDHLEVVHFVGGGAGSVTTWRRAWKMRLGLASSLRAADRS